MFPCPEIIKIGMSGLFLFVAFKMSIPSISLSLSQISSNNTAGGLEPISFKQSSELPATLTLKPSSFKISAIKSLMSFSSSTIKISFKIYAPKKM